MISVKVEFLGITKSRYGRNFEIKLAFGTTIEDFLIKKMKYKKEVVKFFVCRIGGNKVRPSRTLKDADALQLMLPVSGG